MWILMIEALVALFLLVFIVWWTMYSGRKEERHEPGPALENEAEQESAARITRNKPRNNSEP